MGRIGPTEIIIVAVLIIVIFGWKKLPDAARSLGRSARILKAELREGAATPTSDEQSRPEQRPAPAPPREAPRGELRDGSTAPATPGEPQHAELREGSTTTPAASEPLHPEEHR